MAELEKQLSQTKYKLRMEYAKNGKKEEALKELNEALLLDTDKFLFRKQRIIPGTGTLNDKSE